MEKENLYGKMARGRNELIKHREGKKLTYRQAALAKCYDCMGGYQDGKVDCEIPNCSLYPFMPFRKMKSTAPEPPKKGISG